MTFLPARPLLQTNDLGAIPQRCSFHSDEHLDYLFIIAFFKSVVVVEFERLLDASKMKIFGRLDYTLVRSFISCLAWCLMMDAARDGSLSDSDRLE